MKTSVAKESGRYEREIDTFYAGPIWNGSVRALFVRGVRGVIHGDNSLAF